MDELVKLVSEKTGLSEEMSRQVVDVVIGFLKDKLPEPIAGQLDSVLSGGGGMDSIKKGIGGLFG